MPKCAIANDPQGTQSMTWRGRERYGGFTEDRTLTLALAHIDARRLEISDRPVLVAAAVVDTPPKFRCQTRKYAPSTTAFPLASPPIGPWLDWPKLAFQRGFAPKVRLAPKIEKLHLNSGARQMVNNCRMFDH